MHGQSCLMTHDSFVVVCSADFGDDSCFPLRPYHIYPTVNLCSLSSFPILLLCATWRQPEFAPSGVIFTNCWWYAEVKTMDTVSYAFDRHLHNVHFVHLCTNPCLHVCYYVLLELCL
jgi:hypothetical protein